MTFNTLTRPLVSVIDINRAAKQTALMIPGITETQRQEITKRLIACFTHIDHYGYQMAKTIDPAHWPDACAYSSDDALEIMVSLADRIHEKAVLSWFNQMFLNPPLPVGTQIMQGEITGIYDGEPAYYLVKTNEFASFRQLVKFEDAVAIDGQSLLQPQQSSPAMEVQS